MVILPITSTHRLGCLVVAKAATWMGKIPVNHWVLGYWSQQPALPFSTCFKSLASELSAFELDIRIGKFAGGLNYVKYCVYIFTPVIIMNCNICIYIKIIKFKCNYICNYKYISCAHKEIYKCIRRCLSQSVPVTQQFRLQKQVQRLKVCQPCVILGPQFRFPAVAWMAEPSKYHQNLLKYVTSGYLT